MAVNQFLDPTKLSQVENKYLSVFNAVDNLATTYLSLSGGTLTGDVTTTNTTFGNTSLVTKNYVTENTISEAIFDVETLPVSPNIKDVVYRATTTTTTTVTADLTLRDALDSMGFSMEELPGPSGGWIEYKYTPPSGITYTATVEGTDHTIINIGVNIAEASGLFAACIINEGDIGNKVYVQEDTQFTISGPSIHYYLGNSATQTTTELIISSGSSGDNYMLKSGTNNVISSADTDNTILIGTSVFDDEASPALNSKSSITLYTYNNESKVTLNSNDNLLLKFGQYTELDENDDPVSYNGLYLQTTDINDNLYTFFSANSSKLLFTGSQVEFGTAEGLLNNYKFTIGTTAGSGGTDSSAVFTLGFDQAAYDLVFDVNESTSLGGNLAFRIKAQTIGVSPVSHPIEFGSKLLSTQTTVNSFTNDNEFVTKLYVDNHTPDLSGYVSVVDYNDLVYRLNDFLLETSNVEPVSNTFALTAGTNEVTITFNQSVAGSLTIDWGDGAVSTSGDTTGNTTLTHTYAAANTYYLTLTKASGSTITISSVSGTGASVTQASIVDIIVSEFSTNLTKLYIDTSITSTMVDNNANLAKVTIGSDVSSIAELSFAGCTSLATIKVKATTVPTLGGNLFANGTETLPAGFTIYVPASKVADYKAANNWATYANYIVGE